MVDSILLLVFILSCFTLMPHCHNLQVGNVSEMVGGDGGGDGDGVGDGGGEDSGGVGDGNFLSLG